MKIVILRSKNRYGVRERYSMTEASGQSLMNDTTETELIQKIRAGNTSLFNDLVTRYENQIFQYTLRMCGNQLDAEDIFQETFLNAYRAMDTFRGESKFSTWLYRIANNSCLMKRRKSKFAPEQEMSLDEVLADRGLDGDLVRNTSPKASPVDNVISSEFRNLVQAALLELPEMYRKTFILADLQGFRAQEIADILDITVATVKTRLHRARLFLRERLGHYLDNGLKL